MSNFKNSVQSFKDKMVESLQDLIKIKSISEKKEETLKALDFYLNLGKSMGFTASKKKKVYRRVVLHNYVV
jgi:acetylornithine deacetylase/succinyl-diaminopimelate desuccinylase-like protein